jgi:hypothetical protein
MNKINSSAKVLKYPNWKSQALGYEPNDNPVFQQPKVKPVPLFHGPAAMRIAKKIKTHRQRMNVTFGQRTTHHSYESGRRPTAIELGERFILPHKITKYGRVKNYRYATISCPHLHIARNDKDKLGQFKFSHKLDLASYCWELCTLEQLSSGMVKRLWKLLKYCSCLHEVTIKAKTIRRYYLNPIQLVMLVREIANAYQLLKFKLNYSLYDDMHAKQVHQVIKLLTTAKSVTNFMFKLSNPEGLTTTFTNEHLAQMRALCGNLCNLAEFDLRLSNFQAGKLTDLKPLTVLSNLPQLRSINLELHNCHNIDWYSYVYLITSLPRLPKLKELGLTLGNVFGIKDGGNLVNLLAITIVQFVNLEHLSLTLHCFHELDLAAVYNLLTSLKNMANLARLSLNLECERDEWDEAKLDRLLNFIDQLGAICDATFINKFAEFKLDVLALPALEAIGNALSEATAVSSQECDDVISMNNSSEDDLSEGSDTNFDTVHTEVAAMSEEEAAVARILAKYRYLLKHTKELYRAIGRDLHLNIAIT